MSPVPEAAKSNGPPGATMSGLTMAKAPGPRLEYGAIPPDVVDSATPVAPTAMALGEEAASKIIPGRLPKFPAATTVNTPKEKASSMTWAIGE